MNKIPRAHGPKIALPLFARVVLPFVWLLFVICTPLQASEADHYRQVRKEPGLTFAVSDFDGDNKPDLAQVRAGGTVANSTSYFIDIELSTGSRQNVALIAPSGGLRIESRDVNGDHFPDVVISTSWTELPVAVLLNDGRGNFKSVDPSVFQDAFETSDSSLNSPTKPEGDGAAAFFSRTSPSESERVETIYAAKEDLQAAEFRADQFSFLCSRDSFSGRAPPILFFQ